MDVINIILIVLGIFIGTSIATFTTGLVLLKFNRMGDSKGEYNMFSEDKIHIIKKERL